MLITGFAALAAGFLSFLSPCVLPLVPGYISFVSGASLGELRGGPSAVARRRVLLMSLAFVTGFSLVFVALGATATAVGRFVLQHLPVFARSAGAVIVLFGLHTAGVLPVRLLDRERRVRVAGRPAALPGAFLVGVAFAFGWTPCIGPVLMGILALAGTAATVREGVLLLALYSAGLAVPFVLTALATEQFLSAAGRVRRQARRIEIASGILLVAIGVLIFTGQMTWVAQQLLPYLPAF